MLQVPTDGLENSRRAVARSPWSSDRKSHGETNMGQNLLAAKTANLTRLLPPSSHSPSGSPSFSKSRGLLGDSLGLKNEPSTAKKPSTLQQHENYDDEAILSGGPKRPSIDDTAPSVGRRSVQFARPALATEQGDLTHSRSRSWDVQDGPSNEKDRSGSSLFSKIRAIATSSGPSAQARNPTIPTLGGDSINEWSPEQQQLGRGGPSTPGEGSEVDADSEQSAGEDSARNSVSRKKRRKSRRPVDSGPQTAPATPKTPSRPNLLLSSSFLPSDRFRSNFLTRRSTMGDILSDSQQGVSEDEGRERLNRSSPWRRGTAWVHTPRGMSYSEARNTTHQDFAEDRRPSSFRRFTGLGGPGDGNEPSSFSPWKFSRGERGERGESLSAAKWRQLKAGWKMIGQRRKAENTIDHAKSAELLAELTAGVPAALIVASMFQRDEHGNRRIPILLEQLKVRFTESEQVDSKSGGRHMIFRIELEYGNGLTRMKWVIHRALGDFAKLHSRYKLQIGAQKYIQLKPDDARTKLPPFPKSAFPYLRGIRGLESDTEEDEDRDGDGTGPSGAEASGPERPTQKKKRRPSANLIRRRSTGLWQTADDTTGTPARREPYPERQRKKLEAYLQKMIRYLIFRPESNRLCKFLELSALGVRLAAEGSYHGKEGFMVIHSSKGVDSGKAWTPSFLTGRHAPKWFAVRHSYIVCVGSPEDMIIYDVFMVDSSFHIQTKKKRLRDQKPKDIAKAAKKPTTHPQHHTLKLYNSERKVKLLAKNERQLHQFGDSIRFMAQNTIWTKPNRFESFAPVRPKVFAQWLVDGRDYMWNVSRAISMAKDVIYLHGWWISPELYMRRPAAISQKWRLDRLLQRKAQEGVKIFVIMYRNINSAIPIDSEHTKFSLLDLHPNIFVQRSPNQIRQNTFFWAHHEKLCIVDHMVAFVGGIDLCFGRWDTPQHSVVDDKPTGFEPSNAPKDADHCQLWPGKDYSNARVQDFYALDKPYEEMYERSKIPRMPWHDISMQVVGQPARDLTRHFVQRWNYILRQRKSTRPTPFLLPPPDFNPEDLQALELDGTCEVQILRSTCWWSIGTPDKTEHSIMNAYIKMIEQSDHFVYIENQFFISSCEVEGTRIENHIGDALVERIIRAAQKGEPWRAVILIPLMPGFQNTVDSQDGTSVRLIMQCQFRSICRGDSSIFSRIRAEGVEPEDYISFYSLRSWGKIGPTKQLVTEQLYIHAKCMIVDDRIAIIGSANINERSMLGSRDSECAAVVRDTDMIWSTMNSEPYMVGRFPHTLRMHLMREHLGVDVDEVAENERQDEEKSQVDQWERDMDAFHDEENSRVENQDQRFEQGSIKSETRKEDDRFVKYQGVSSLDQPFDLSDVNKRRRRSDSLASDKPSHRKAVKTQGLDILDGDRHSSRAAENGKLPIDDDQFSMFTATDTSKLRSSNLRKSASPRRSRSAATEDFGNDTPPKPIFPRQTTEQLGFPLLSQLPALPDTDDTDIGGPCAHFATWPKSSGVMHPLVEEIQRPIVNKDCMRDPLNDSFFLDVWHAVAENNTKIFRTVFRCMPDNEVKTWKEYKEYVAYADRFTQAQGGEKSKDRIQREVPGSSGPPGQINVTDKMNISPLIHEKGFVVGGINETLGEKLVHKLDPREPNHHTNARMSKVEEWAEETTKAQANGDEQEHSFTTAVGRQRESPAGDPALDEKAAMRSPDELKNLTPLKPNSTVDSNGGQEKPTPSSVDVLEAPTTHSTTTNRRRRATIRGPRREFRASDDVIGRADAEVLMNMVQGHLVVWPYDWYVNFNCSFIFVSSKI